MTKKDFFQEESLAEIKKKVYVPFREVGIEGLHELAFSNFYTIIPETISGNDEAQKRFIKHGQELKLPRVYSTRDAQYLEDTSLILKELFDNLRTIPSCYSFKPYWGLDRKTRRVHLIDCVNGARLYAYANQSEEEIQVAPYAKSKRTSIEGARILLSVPSTTVGNKPYEFSFGFIPLEKNGLERAISLQLSSDHSCNYKRFRGLKYNLESSNSCSETNDFCFHEIAGRLAIVDYFKQQGIITPLETSPFVIPTLSTKDFNIALERNVLLLEKNSLEDLRKPKLADKEILNWLRVQVLGFDETFFSRKTRDGNLRDYRWV